MAARPNGVNQIYEKMRLRSSSKLLARGFARLVWATRTIPLARGTRRPQRTRGRCCVSEQVCPLDDFMLGGEQEFLAHAFVPQQPARHLNQPLRLASLVSFPPDKGNRRRRQSLPAGSRNLARRARPGPSYRRCTEREPKQYARRRSSRKGARSRRAARAEWSKRKPG